jgi:hypothetical protein
MSFLRSSTCLVLASATLLANCGDGDAPGPNEIAARVRPVARFESTAPAPPNAPMPIPQEATPQQAAPETPQQLAPKTPTQKTSPSAQKTDSSDPGPSDYFIDLTDEIAPTQSQ